jgi:hypothetical protein
VGPSRRRLAVGPIQPADRGTRFTCSHFGKRLEHEIPGFGRPRGGPGGAPCSGPGLPGSQEGAGGQVGLGSSRFPAGFRPAAPVGPGGARRSAARGGKKGASRLESWHGTQCGGHCRALVLLLRLSRQSPRAG